MALDWTTLNHSALWQTLSYQVDPTRNFEFLKDARTNDHKCGYTCKERELLKWTKTRKKHIRREDLIANITGESSYLG